MECMRVLAPRQVLDLESQQGSIHQPLDRSVRALAVYTLAPYPFLQSSNCHPQPAIRQLALSPIPGRRSLSFAYLVVDPCPPRYVIDYAYI